MDDTIKLKPVEQISSAGLLRGEWAIDEEGARLVISVEDGLEEIPLDRIPLPQPTQADIDSGNVLMMGASGPSYGVLIAGAGGAPLDKRDTRWCVPGVLPINIVENRTISAPWNGIIEISEPVLVTEMRATPAGGIDWTISFGIKTMQGEDVFRVYDSAYAGPLEVPVNVVLPVGRYKLFMEVEDAIEFQTIRGFLPWSNTEVYYPIFLRVTHAPPE